MMRNKEPFDGHCLPRQRFYSANTFGILRGSARSYCFDEIGRENRYSRTVKTGVGQFRDKFRPALSSIIHNKCRAFGGSAIYYILI